MRRWFVLLMIVLLPVRGWAGDFMGIQMALAGATPSAHEMPADCPMHASADMSAHHGGSGDTGSNAPADDGAGSNCTSCQLCTPVAQLPATPLLLAHAPARSAPESVRSEFVSASLAPAVEPPIS